MIKLFGDLHLIALNLYDKSYGYGNITQLRSEIWNENSIELNKK